jgi:hypothetical protein
MKASEFVEVINSCQEQEAWSDTANELFNGDLYRPNKGILKELLDRGYVIAVEDSYGGEGQGEEFWSVFSVTHEGETTFFRFDGWYASFAGSEMSGGPLDFVKVKKVPVETYEWQED